MHDPSRSFAILAQATSLEQSSSPPSGWQATPLHEAETAVSRARQVTQAGSPHFTGGQSQFLTRAAGHPLSPRAVRASQATFRSWQGQLSPQSALVGLASPNAACVVPAVPAASALAPPYQQAYAGGLPIDSFQLAGSPHLDVRTTLLSPALRDDPAMRSQALDHVQLACVDASHCSPLKAEVAHLAKLGMNLDAKEAAAVPATVAHLERKFEQPEDQGRRRDFEVKLDADCRRRQEDVNASRADTLDSMVISAESAFLPQECSRIPDLASTLDVKLQSSEDDTSKSLQLELAALRAGLAALEEQKRQVSTDKESQSHTLQTELAQFRDECRVLARSAESALQLQKRTEEENDRLHEELLTSKASSEELFRVELSQARSSAAQTHEVQELQQEEQHREAAEIRWRLQESTSTSEVLLAELRAAEQERDDAGSSFRRLQHENSILESAMHTSAMQASEMQTQAIAKHRQESQVLEDQRDQAARRVQQVEIKLTEVQSALATERLEARSASARHQTAESMLVSLETTSESQLAAYKASARSELSTMEASAESRLMIATNEASKAAAEGENSRRDAAAAGEAARRDLEARWMSELRDSKDKVHSLEGDCSWLEQMKAEAWSQHREMQEANQSLTMDIRELQSALARVEAAEAQAARRHGTAEAELQHLQSQLTLSQNQTVLSSTLMRDAGPKQRRNFVSLPDAEDLARLLARGGQG
mmetsp:Transcript_51124/g.121477  ORF Transcript_51124/g.121477 Transcript_51124/m.121477 type:complete len:713 (+) Transcript_51124:91-2229(+)